MEWFKVNSLKANPGKFQFMVLGNKDKISFNIHVNKVKIKNSNEVTLLSVKNDKNLTFKKRTSKLCRRASYEHHTLHRVRKYLTVEKAKLLANAFINRHFNYVPLIWMFANRSSIDKIMKIYKRTLQIAYPGFTWNLFERNHIPYNLRRGGLLLLPPAKSARYGVNSLAFRGSLLWNNLPPPIVGDVKCHSNFY